MANVLARLKTLFAARYGMTPWLAVDSYFFLDPEIMIKAHYLGVSVLEMNVFARMRSNGRSHIRASTCWEFFRQLLRYRFTSHLAAWRRSLRERPSTT